MRYPLKSDWLFYLFLLSYAYLIINMTARLWFGEGINIFASYTDTALSPALIVEANKVYWSKTCFLFSMFLLVALRFDFRAACGLGGIFWAGSLMLMFGPTQNLIGGFVIGLGLVAQQAWRGTFFVERTEDKAAPNQA